MSEPVGDSAPGGASDSDSGAAPPPAPAYRGVAITLAAALLLLAAVAGTAPFWAPFLPWAPPAADPRIDQIEQALTQIRQEQAAAATTRQELDRRIAALAAKPASPTGDIADLRQQVATLSTANADLGSQIAALGKTVQSQQPAGAELARRIAALDDAVQAQAKTGAELTARVEAIEQAAHRATATGSSGTAIVLLQIRGALASGRPFAAEYDALTAAARNRPQIIAAAAPLATPAKTGVWRRAALLERLRRLAPALGKAAAPEPAGADAGWSGQLLARLQGLVRVRRVDGAGRPTSGGAAAIEAAERALADGDLAASVAAIERLDDGAAAAARPWLDMAKQRLAAEQALQQIEADLAADLGAAARPPAAAGTAR